MKNLSPIIPVFPLGGALLLPGGSLPLNIFEPRYISMVDYALSHEKLVGMIQPIKNHSEEIYKIGCVGKISNFIETDDNRYLINLVGISKFEIIKEVKHKEKFKLFNVQYNKSDFNFNDFNRKLFNKDFFIKKINLFLKKKGFVADLKNIENTDIKTLIIATAMICPFDINEKQALLESKDINSLANTIISLFDFYNNESIKYDSIN